VVEDNTKFPSARSSKSTGYLLKLIAKGPQAGEGVLPVEGGPGQAHNPSRPMSAAPDALGLAATSHPMRS